MIRILLIRHATAQSTGQMLYGRMPGIHLTEQGQREAQALAASVKARYRVDRLISSPLERAMETARHLSTALDVPITTEEEIIELDYGAWLGMKFEDIRESEDWQHYNKLRSLLGPPEGELTLEVQHRAWRALKRAMSPYIDLDGTTIAMVSHGDVIRALLVLLLGMPLDNIHRLDVAPASLSEIHFDGHYARVTRVNQVPF